eukprot:gene14028-15487_t
MAQNTSFINPTVYTHTNSTTQPDEKHVITTIISIRVALYSVCLVLGLIGNALVIITTCIQKNASRSRFLLAHLALSDVIFCLRLPLQIRLELTDNTWNYGSVFCKLFHCINSMSMLASIGTMTVIALERHRGITKSFVSTVSRAKILYSIAIVWIIAVITYTPLFFIRNAQGDTCREMLLHVHWQQAYSLFLLFMKYILPLSIIAFCYYKIIKVIRNRPITAYDQSQNKSARRRKRDRADNRIVKILIVMVVAFAVLTLPASIWWILYDFGGLDASEKSMEIIEVFGGLVYFQSCVNPIVYFIMDGKFRADVLRLLKCSCFLRLLCPKKIARKYRFDRIDFVGGVSNGPQNASTILPLSIVNKSI